MSTEFVTPPALRTLNRLMTPVRSAESPPAGTMKVSPTEGDAGFLRGTRQDFATVSDERVTSFAIFSLNHLRLDAG